MCILGVNAPPLSVLKFGRMDPNLIRAVQSIADSMKNHYWPLSAGDIAQIALCILTGFTLWYLRRYTRATVALRVATRDQVLVNNQVLNETVGLRKATQAQVEVTNQMLAETVELRKATRDQADASIRLLEESQKQTETSIMPVLILTTAFSGEHNNFLIRNVGRGPALNSRTELLVSGPKTNWELHHRSAFAASQQEFAVLNTGSGTPAVLPVGLVKHLRDVSKVGELWVRMEYQSTSGNWYETTHKLYLTAPKNDLIISVERFMRIEHKPRQMQPAQQSTVA